MSLNIKNEETHRLARELAQLTGETMTGAITVALKERLEGSASAVLTSAVEPQEIRKRMSKLPMRPGPSAVEPTHDERGLPA